MEVQVQAVIILQAVRAVILGAVQAQAVTIRRVQAVQVQIPLTRRVTPALLLQARQPIIGVQIPIRIPTRIQTIILRLITIQTLSTQ